MKNGMLTYLLAGLFLLNSAFTSAQKSNFAGSWVYSAKNEAPENGFKMGPIKMVVTQDELNLTTERTYEGRDGENITGKETVTLDGNLHFYSKWRYESFTYLRESQIIKIANPAYNP